MLYKNKQTTTTTTGKTVASDGPNQYGRATRHRDVFQCSVGAFGFYLLHRFDVNGEFEEGFDFKHNEAWFDKKVLVEMGTGDCDTMMTQRPFRDSVKEVFTELGITANHLAHFGRVTAPVFLEFKELPPELIKILGKFFFSRCCCCF